MPRTDKLNLIAVHALNINLLTGRSQLRASRSLDFRERDYLASFMSVCPCRATNATRHDFGMDVAVMGELLETLEYELAGPQSNDDDPGLRALDCPGVEVC